MEEEARDLSGEAFFCFMDQLYDRITSLLESNDVAENLGALRAIDELIDMSLGENSSKVSRFSNYVRSMFEATQDGLGRNAPIHSIHGSLLTVGELLSYHYEEFGESNILIGGDQNPAN
ncbi:hypothetical protein ACSBR1_023790 [Camellia fascicularis]